jgi:hypothetical protein
LKKSCILYLKKDISLRTISKIVLKKYLMRKFFTLLAFIGFCEIGFAQTLTPEEAAKHVGDNVKVCGKIYGGRFFETSNNSPTLLNMGAAFPASPITIMLTLEVRNKLGYTPEQELKEKNICVTGKVELFKGKPEIVVSDIAQLEISTK